MSMCSMEQGTKTTPAVEVWRPVVGWEGLYEVSSHGRVRSLDRMVEQPIANGVIITRPYFSKILVQRLNMDGYHRVNLTKKGKRDTASVHQLVAEAFIPNPDNLPCINHKDEDKDNNHVENLEWCSWSYNNNYNNRQKKIGAKISKRLEQLTLDGQHVAFHRCANDSGFNVSSIRNAIYRGQTLHGYRWRYVN